MPRSGGEDFDGEVRGSVPEAFGDAGGGDASGGDEGEIRGEDGVGMAGDEEAGFGAEALAEVVFFYEGTEEDGQAIGYDAVFAAGG